MFKPVKSSSRNFLQKATFTLLPLSWFRELLNRWHLSASPRQREDFYGVFAKIFRNGPGRFPESATWRFNFMGRTLHIPLRRRTLWLDWDLATAILGHDLDVKLTYEFLLRGRQRPRVFYDIGANYGTHTLLMASQGLQCFAFEPNPLCREYASELWTTNRVVPVVIDKAIGAGTSLAELHYSSEDTWNGTLASEGVVGSDVISVQVSSLDDVIRDEQLPLPDLIKIDTEGFELQVLEGASATLERCRPVIVFESFSHSFSRPLIYEWFNQHGYYLVVAPLGQERRNFVAPPLEGLQFHNCEATNFVALPR